jgi:CheY-like chemotaxis protein
MAYAFDGSGFGQFLVDAQRLIAAARDHEQQLASFLAIVEDERARVGAPPLEAPAGLLADRLRLAAGEHRQLAETLLTRLIGPVSNAALPSRIRVLVVDDSDSSRETTATILEEAGFDAITAANGLEGVIVAHYANPLVVLMDVTMPVLDGLEAARLLQASGVTRDVNVIAYTGKLDARDAPFARFFVDVLQKPAAPDAIVAAVERSVEASRTRKAVPTSML